MKRILVTGANKGIGLGIVERILGEHTDTFVYLGSRDADRGRAAVAGLVGAHADWAARVEPVAIDVSNDASVSAAKAHVKGPLYGIVNNAGISTNSGDLRAVLETNVLGIRRVCDAFLPLLDPKSGRVVNVTSAAGPTFVSKCSPEMQRFFLDRDATWPRLRAFVEECLALAPGGGTAFEAKGLSDGSGYGLSKACANVLTMIVARENPGLLVNACTPGFIATDMTRHYAESEGKTPAELGMKTPAEGATAPLHLLFGDVGGSGQYFGSDAKRSPLDRYRAPGSPAYTGT